MRLTWYDDLVLLIGMSLRLPCFPEIAFSGNEEGQHMFYELY
jgi:hypothetical protein